MTSVPAEIEHWCHDSIDGDYALKRFTVESGFHTAFQRKADAVKFKLRWLPDWGR